MALRALCVDFLRPLVSREVIRVLCTDESLYEGVSFLNRLSFVLLGTHVPPIIFVVTMLALTCIVTLIRTLFRSEMPVSVILTDIFGYLVGLMLLETLFAPAFMLFHGIRCQRPLITVSGILSLIMSRYNHIITYCSWTYLLFGSFFMSPVVILVEFLKNLLFLLIAVLFTHLFCGCSRSY